MSNRTKRISSKGLVLALAWAGWLVPPALAQDTEVPQVVSDQEIKTFFRSGHSLKCAVGQAAQMQGDHETALWIFNTCARENNLFGVMSLALYYELGLGVPRSDERAAQLYRQAAHHPDHAGYGKNGKYYYALALLQGRGVPQDQTEGLYWMREAARFGQREAVAYLSELDRTARPVGEP
jgi:uncharacterized protein